MTIPWLADELRAAGLTVVEHAGWRTRVIPGSWSPRYGVVHATAAPRSQPDSTQVAIVRDGRSDLDGPIAVATVDHGGRWHVLGAGRCNTTLVGTAGPYKGLGNQYALGVEACNDNISEPWPDVQYRAYYRGWAAICRRLGWTEQNLVGHKEHTPGRKTDPTFNMDQFRRNVAAVLAGEDDDDMAFDTLDEARLNAATERTAGIAAMKPEIVWTDPRDNSTKREPNNLAAAVLRIEAGLAQLAGRDWVDEQAIVDGVLAGLGSKDLDDVAAALRAALGDDRAAELGALLVATGGTTGTGSA